MPPTAPSPPPAVDRRVLRDRRLVPTPLRSIFRWKGRRQCFRRAGEGANQYADCPSGRTTFLALAVISLSGFDALFTLLHLERGGQEINPAMALMLLLGVPAFLVAKTTLTDLGILCLVVHERFRLAQRALSITAAVYSILLVYHAALVFRAAG